jgi:hypothetical protein
MPYREELLRLLPEEGEHCPVDILPGPIGALLLPLMLIRQGRQDCSVLQLLPKVHLRLL